MKMLPLHGFHQTHRARFGAVNGREVVLDYGQPETEYRALTRTVAITDLSARSRVCLTGADRQRFLHGQVTNQVNGLEPGQGCYAALITAKGRMVSDGYIYVLEEEILLDFEPGLSERVTQRLEQYIIADDVQVVPVEDAYGLISIQGPRTRELLVQAGLPQPPEAPLGFVCVRSPEWTELYAVNQARTGVEGCDLFAPVSVLETLASRLASAAPDAGGALCGWDALELARIEAGIPRFLADMDETNLPPETGIEGRAISYTKGCYIGQEIISRIRAYGQVTRHLAGLRLGEPTGSLPEKGTKLHAGEKEAGYITSAAVSPRWQAVIALGYVRREFNQPGARLRLETATGEIEAEIVRLPFSE